jgi:hypothetical protein
MNAMFRSSHVLIRLGRLILAVIALLPPVETEARIRVPSNLSESEREEALKILGFGTSGKILSDPYPLGGYAGFEFGISVESLPTGDLGSLGSGLSDPQPDVLLSKFSLGKGLYNNVDLFLQFSPYTQQDEISQFGGIVRWGFYQAAFLPLNASLSLSANSANIGNQIIARSYSFDLIGGINVENVALFAGVGFVEASGTFLGGSQGITDTGLQETEIATSSHTVVGATARFSNLFLSVQIDRHVQPSFSGKIGVRF